MVVNLETRDQGSLSSYLIAKCHWLGSVDKSASRWWTNSLYTVHSKMMFCQWSSSHTPRINNIVLNFETKEQRRLFPKMHVESIDKSPIISTQEWTNSLGKVHSKMGSPAQRLSMKYFTYSKEYTNCGGEH